TTTIYVTHDQVEAMTMGDRVAIMTKGVLAQVGAPREVYERPANVFVAGFIGSPSMQFARASASRGAEGVTLSHGSMTLKIDASSQPLPAEVTVGIRPEHAHPWGNGRKLIGPIDGQVEYVEMLGRESMIGVEVAEDTRLVLGADPD